MSTLMKRILPVLVLTCIYSAFFTASCQNLSEHQIPYVLPPEPEPEPVDTAQTIRITAVGDLMCHSPQFKNAMTGKDSFDFRPCFSEVKPILESADFTIGNIETTFSGDRLPYKGYPNFNTPVEYLVAIKDAGFDFLVSSNNHTMDTGEKGVKSTIKALDSLGFGRTGSFISQEDRDSIRVVDIQGITMAIVNYTYGMNGYTCPEGKDWMVNLIDTTLIKQDIAAAKALGPDLVCVFYHYGAEYIHEPNLYERECVDVAIRSGADLILGAHPHVVQPIEYFATQGGNIDTGIVVWSMGNFLSNQGQRYRDAGIIVNLELTKDLRDEKIHLSGVNYVPTWVFRGNHPDRKPHAVLPSEKVLEADFAYAFVDEAGKKKMKQAFEDVNQYANLYQEIPRMSPKDWEPAGAAQADRIVFHSGVCFGTCPDYCLSVDANGAMEMWGGRFADKCGFFKGQVPDSLLAQVKFILQPEAWLSLEDHYDASFTDASTFETAYVQGGRIIKGVRDYGAAGPKLLKSVYELMRKLYLAPVWKAMEPGALTCYQFKVLNYKYGEQPVRLNQAENFFLWQEWQQNQGVLDPPFTYEIAKEPHFPYQGGRMSIDSPRQPNCVLGGLALDSVSTDGRVFELHFQDAHLMKIDLGYDFFGENAIREKGKQ